MKSSKAEEFERILSKDVIPLSELKTLCFQGCLEGSNRSLCWKLMLNYLPADRANWKRLETCRADYIEYIHEFIIKPGVHMQAEADDHPLSSEPDSTWANYFRDNELLLQIHKDCRRLYPDHNFFQQPTLYPCSKLLGLSEPMDTLRKRVEYSTLHSEALSPNRLALSSTHSCATVPGQNSHNSEDVASPFQNLFSKRIVVAPLEVPHIFPSDQLAKQNAVKGKQRTFLTPATGNPYGGDDSDSNLPAGAERHWEVVERVLFLYCKVNQSQGYVQGMNEIVGPLYFVFANDPDPEERKHAEEDTFFCFVNLMTEVQESFIRTMDNDMVCGINGRMRRMMQCLRELDYALWVRLQEQKLLPEYFAFRWISLLLSQELKLPDLLRVWDSLFADPERFRFLDYVCCAMLILIREELMVADFSEAMRLVQNYPLDDIQMVLSKAYELASRS